MTQQVNTLTVWALLDDRMGNTNQTLGLAEALGYPYQEKQINYTCAILLPNVLKLGLLSGIDAASKDLLSPPWPDVVIAAGRRLAGVARYIKSQSPDVSLIHIMWPDSNVELFDAIMLPKHDIRPAHENVIPIIGALNRINKPMLTAGKTAWQSTFEPYSQPRIGVLLGGDTKKGIFTKTHGREFAEQINRLLAQTPHASLLISSSRRTSETAQNAFLETLSIPYYFYDYRKEGENPIRGIMGCSDGFIASADSVSMVSEVCATGKPVYLYTNNSLLPDKHQRFVESVLEHGCAKKLAGESFSEWTYSPLCETARVAQMLKKSYLALPDYSSAI